MNALYVIKYYAAIVFALYGLYATLNDLRKKKHGKKILSKKGWAGIVLLVISTLLSLSGEVQRR
jgi:hypothetical protein